MKIFKEIDTIANHLDRESIVVTIGNFDGVHIGHHEFLSVIKKEALKTNSKFLVITFIPHPAQALKGQAGFLINRYEERRDLLAKEGVDYLLEVDFTRDFSTLSPLEFVEKYIQIFRNVKCVYLGHDFSFGANRGGDHFVAKSIFESLKIPLKLQDEFKLLQSTVSSSEVRAALKMGDVEKASLLLGRKFFISGRVVKGQGRGKQIGFPTANLEHDREVILPAKGVYLTQTQIKDMIYFSVTNVGANPTFNSDSILHVESHLLNFSNDIYGDEIKVYFYKKLRDEKKFITVNDLVEQINSDVQNAQQLFKTL